MKIHLFIYFNFVPLIVELPFWFFIYLFESSSDSYKQLLGSKEPVCPRVELILKIIKFILIIIFLGFIKSKPC